MAARWSNVQQDRFLTCFKTCFEGWGVGAKSLGVKAGQTDRHQTYRTSCASGPARNTSSAYFVIVII